MNRATGGTDLAALGEAVRGCRTCAESFAATATGHRPRPVRWLSDHAPILIAGQAPGARVHALGRPFDDASGDRLRHWLGVDRARFYDPGRFAILPMAFCFPGYDAKGSDLPPPPICAATWRARALALMPQLRLVIAIGGHAQRWHLRGAAAGGVTRTVRGWRDVRDRQDLRETIPLPHPSWRNTGWLKRNPWFEAELVPVLRARVAALIGEG